MCEPIVCRGRRRDGRTWQGQSVTHFLRVFRHRVRGSHALRRRARVCAHKRCFREGDARPDLIKPSRQQTARVTLNDCLACRCTRRSTGLPTTPGVRPAQSRNVCSGCVTSAETVLIQQQSAAEVRAAIASKVSVPRSRPAAAPPTRLGARAQQFKVIVVSISPQVRSSLAAYFNLSGLSTHKRLVSYFKVRAGPHAHAVAGRERLMPRRCLCAAPGRAPRVRHRLQCGLCASGGGRPRA